LITLAEPVDWGALDGRPVDLVVVFAGPEAARSAHIRLLARISHALARPDIRHALAEAATVEEVLDALRSAERG